MVYFRQMPLLSALLELCVNTLELAAVDEVFQEMVEGGATAKKVSGAANGVASAALRLSQAAPARRAGAAKAPPPHRLHAEAQRRGLRRAADRRRRGARLLVPGGGQREPLRNRFQALPDGAARAFIHLHATLEQGRELYALARPDSVGHRSDEGEVDPGGFEAAAFGLDGRRRAPSPHLRPWVIQGIVDDIDCGESPLARLGEPPLSRVKFLNEQEKKDLASVVDAGEEAWAMPLTMLRSDVFDPAQRRVSRASGSRLRKLLAEEPVAGLRRAAAAPRCPAAAPQPGRGHDRSGDRREGSRRRRRSGLAAWWTST